MVFVICVLNDARTIAPSNATANNPATLATALFTPDAAPEYFDSTARAYLVSGAITIAIPIPIKIREGKK